MEIFEVFKDYIAPELVVLVPVLYLLGAGLKKSQYVADKHIPAILGAAGIVLAALYILATTTFAGWQTAVMAVFTAVVQGVLCAGGSVFVNQLVKQSAKTE